jgi:dimethylhistidine N-methyltransferase
MTVVTSGLFPMAAKRQPRLINRQTAEATGQRDELAAGLLAPAAHISPKFLYDSLGSRLFSAITEVEEYYPTRTEAEIFNINAEQIAACIAPGCTLVDLGAGDCAKARSLFPSIKPASYVAVDISVDFLVESLDYLQFRHPEMDITGLGCDFSSKLDLPDEIGDGPRVLFYPGSSIGNFTPEQALVFLRQARAASQGGGLLIGIDLVKPQTVLDAAYDDALGITAAFNLNLLNAVNRQLGANFVVGNFRHIAFFNAEQSRIEMHLEARHTNTVTWPGGERCFVAGERIHTENSYKYTVDRAKSLLNAAGFRLTRCWTDEKGWFALFWATD